MKQDDLTKQGYTKFKAPAKINLFLRVTGVRDDGFHELQSVFQLIDLYDDIYIKIRSDTQINFINESNKIIQQDDIGLKAAKLILKDKKLGVDIYLKKNIPIGAGLGGGSSDAATILMAINALAHLNYTKMELMEIGLRLGADVPFFIFGENAWVEGIGESLSKIDIPESVYYLCYPSFPISTESIFKSFKLTKVPITLKITTYFSDKLELQTNDLEYIITKKYIKMKELLNWMNNFGFAKISGTGSSVFMKINDANQIKFLDEKKPIDIKSFIVKGLSTHPFYDV
ncbi:MAG: 4-(cytidine 5'-diphospho)-2-C-methyl-D-erythritol kinase [Flavobacteriaceae bacterium]|mgnify:CR=1 FL=1|nr:4-(cytidine 5'-diphospho)-2-C-methyl-D-erythritol kinase [Nitrosomonadales bacterium]MBT6356247.1 4-(cytidine 5'-diphospho)-2-C-methyl-D-erythritol kinase [Nitrosomonadales bacterium]MBT7653545.1 4-(cytidine 5'-diphospho)-2-C-methyl-D-erythritol kinase [Flavobacteriaceae bacterium]